MGDSVGCWRRWMFVARGGAAMRRGRTRRSRLSNGLRRPAGLPRTRHRAGCERVRRARCRRKLSPVGRIGSRIAIRRRPLHDQVFPRLVGRHRGWQRRRCPRRRPVCRGAVACARRRRGCRAPAAPAVCAGRPPARAVATRTLGPDRPGRGGGRAGRGRPLARRGRSRPSSRRRAASWSPPARRGCAATSRRCWRCCSRPRGAVNPRPPCNWPCCCPMAPGTARCGAG